jgi:hypothetical protein
MFFSEAECVDLHLHGVSEITPVPPGHRDGDRNAPLPQGLEHTAVALGEACGAELQATEAVTLVRVGAG